MARKLEKTPANGLIIGKFLPPHAGHLYLIKQAAKQVQRLTVMVCALNAEPISGVLRLDWMRQLCPDATVILNTDENPSYPEDHPDFWDIWRESIMSRLPQAPDVVFSGEAYGETLAQVLGARHVCVDRVAGVVPISGSLIRQNPYQYWTFLPSPVRAYYAFRVGMLGAESTGKTTLAQALADALQTDWIQEYGRIFVDEHGRLPVQEEMAFLAAEQLRLEDEAAARCNQVLIGDTTPHTTRLYSDYYFGSSSDALIAAVKRARYDLLILAEDDIPWVADGMQRDGAHVRAALQPHFRKAVQESGFPWIAARGNLSERLAFCMEEIRSRLNCPPKRENA